MFEATVRRAPDAVAVHYLDAALTYAELDALSGAFAAALAQRGVARGDRVALYLQNVPEFVIAVLAAWKLGRHRGVGQPDAQGARGAHAARGLRAGGARDARVAVASETSRATAVAGHLGAHRRRPTHRGRTSSRAPHAGARPPPDPRASGPTTSRS